MLIRFTTPSTLGTTEYASGAEADLPHDVANMALSLGRDVRVMSDAVLTVASDAAVEPAAPTADPAPDDDATSRPRRR